MDTNCPFCTIATEERFLKEGTHAYVIFSNPRLMRGHLLVIPKRHVYALSELNEDEKKEIFDLLVEFQTKILSKLSTGCDVRLNYKPYVKNSRTHVSHMHFHLLPRSFQDELQEKAEKYKDPLYQDLEESEKSEIAKLLA
jgi:diadenosine tetraphosphate (Ap4A) HIT family hydrolase